jgi:glycosyltransferase involved in cell wall biosynthesis
MSAADSATTNTSREPVPAPDAHVVAVLQVVPSLGTGGAERATVDIARALTRIGWTALVASEGGRLEAELRSAGGELIRLPASRKSPGVMLANALHLERLIRARSVNLIHARSRAPAWSAALAARRTKIPFVTTYHGFYRAQNPLKQFYNSIMVRSDAVIANSQWTAEHIKKTYGTIGGRLVTIPRGIDTKLFDPARVPHDLAAALRTQWRARADDILVLLPGRLTRWKGQQVFLSALSLLKRGGLLGNVRAVIAGDAQGREHYVAELKGAILQYGLGDNVVLSGHIAGMATAYAAADIVVSASIEPEAFGRVAAEAGAMGKPVIATDHGGARETVVAGETGYLVEPGRAEALAKALAELMAKTQDERTAMGAKARAHILARFTVERMCADTLALYRDLLRRA